jgi:hypothetical protein
MSDQPILAAIPPEVPQAAEQEQPEKPPEPSPAEGGTNSYRRRARALLILVALSAIAYLAALFALDLARTPSERTFVAGPEGARRLKLYVEPLSVDPVNDAMQMRVHVTPHRPQAGGQAEPPDRNVRVILTTGDAVEERVFRTDETAAPMLVGADLNRGSVVHYPFDHYRSDLRIQVLESTGSAPDLGQPVATEITVWEGLLGYRLRATAAPSSAPGDTHLHFDLRRASAHIFFAVAAYGAMAVLACCSLAISFLIFLGHRKVEATLMGALAALVFALPALRNAIPLAPPLGVWADLVVFLWAELAAVMGIALLVVSWARQPPA